MSKSKLQQTHILNLQQYTHSWTCNTFTTTYRFDTILKKEHSIFKLRARAKSYNPYIQIYTTEASKQVGFWFDLYLSAPTYLFCVRSSSNTHNFRIQNIDKKSVHFLSRALNILMQKKRRSSRSVLYTYTTWPKTSYYLVQGNFGLWLCGLESSKLYKTHTHTI